MKALNYLPGFTVTHFANLLNKVKVVNGGATPAKGLTNISLKLGLETFTIRVEEKLEANSFELLLGLKDETATDFAVEEWPNRNNITITQNGIVSIERMREVIFNIFKLLIEEGHYKAVEEFTRFNQTWLVDLWACRSMVYFMPESVVPSTDSLVDTVIEEGYFVAKSVYSVVQ